jgi:hypothetical protein
MTCTEIWTQILCSATTSPALILIDRKQTSQNSNLDSSDDHSEVPAAQEEAMVISEHDD